MVQRIQTVAEFKEVIQNDTLVLIDFYADWCGPCRMIAPFLAKLETENAGKLVVYKVNVDDDVQELSDEYNVESIPTFVAFRKGKMLGTLSGANKEKLTALVVKNLE